MFPPQVRAKRLHPNVINGHQGEQLVSARAGSMGFAFHTLNRLETGIDGMMELRDQTTHAMLGKWVGVQVKTTEGDKYTAETDARFEYLLDPSDLAYWRQSRHLTPPPKNYINGGAVLGGWISAGSIEGGVRLIDVGEPLLEMCNESRGARCAMAVAMIEEMADRLRHGPLFQ